MEKISFNEILKSGLTRQEKARQIADKIRFPKNIPGLDSTM